MYAVVNTYYKHGENYVDLMSEDKMRKYCLEKIIEYVESEKTISDTKKYVLAASYAKKEIESPDPETLKKYEYYTLKRLMKMVLTLGRIMMEEENDYGVTQIIYGNDMNVLGDFVYVCE